MLRFLVATALLSIATSAIAQQTPTPAAAPWWNLTTELANDSMQGRDTGSEAYERAARVVANHFTAAGLKPGGDPKDGQATYFQRVPMHQVDLDTAHSSAELVDSTGAYTPLAFLYDITLSPRTDWPAFSEGDLVFIGYGVGKDSEPLTRNLRGKIAVYCSNTPASLPPAERESYASRRMHVLVDSGAAGFLAIDNPGATEPSHWPAAFARTVTLSGSRPSVKPPLGLRISAESAPKLFAGTNINPAKIIADAEQGLPLPSIDLARKLRVSLKFTEKDISSPNVLAILPGSDPSLASEYVVVSAHLDGYGYGTPVLGDNLYNGALDDAAYVATLEELAYTIRPKPPARSVLFCIFTGEEKGLLGSVFFTQHLTVPRERIVADFNLDQLRPIFPLKILTMEGITDSTLGDTAKTVAKQFGIELRPDRETERSLFRRADNYSFVRIGVPIAGFIFGYDPGTESERIYRDWYARRYHKPQDDILTPIDWAAAVTFNDFYRALVLTVANDTARPQWLPGSPYAPKP